MNQLLLVLLAVAGSGVVAYAVTTVLVVVMDALGLVYSPSREARSHADDVPTFNVAARRRHG